MVGETDRRVELTAGKTKRESLQSVVHRERHSLRAVAGMAVGDTAVDAAAAAARAQGGTVSLAGCSATVAVGHPGTAAVDLVSAAAVVVAELSASSTSAARHASDERASPTVTQLYIPGRT